MTLLTPWLAGLAAAVTLPPLFLLYFLKLRRQPMRIGSTLLWRQTIEDLQVNAPFQRLRWSLLLLIQLLILALLILAMGRPVIDADQAGASRIILLIDRSASMRTVDAGAEVSRLELARQAALRTIDALGRGDEPGEMMVIAFGRQAQVISSFESNRSLLRDAVRSITQTDEPGDLDAALQVANAFAARIDSEDRLPPVVTLISDGCLAPGERSRAVSASEFRYVRIGPSGDRSVDNIGIVAFSARRSVQDRTVVELFARLINTGDEPVSTALSLRIDGAIDRVETIEVPPRRDANSEALPNEARPGEAVFSTTIDLPMGGVVTLSHSRADALATDDTASVIVPPPTAPRVAIIAPEGTVDPFLRAVLDLVEPTSLRIIPAFEYTQNGLPSELDADLLIFDRTAPERLPDVPSITLGSHPEGFVTVAPSRAGGRRVLSWDRQHALLRHVELDSIVFAGFGGFIDLADDVRVLADGPDGPIIVSTERRGALHVIIGFELIQSNWPTHVSLLVFMQNMLDAMNLGQAAEAGSSHQPGDTIEVRPSPGVDRVTIEGPRNAVVEVGSRSHVTLPILREVGLYRVSGVEPPHDRLALTLASVWESNVRPAETVTVNAERVEGQTGLSTGPRDLWPWLLAAALVLLTFEWLIYISRVRSA